MTVHVVGNVCVDSSFHLARLPQPGETLNADGVEEGLGGKGANQAIAAARAGASVTLWAAVGHDTAADRMQALLTAELAGARLSRFDLPSDRSVILVDGAGENVIVTAAACAASFRPLAEGVLPRTWKSGDSLLMQGNLSVDETAACLRHAQAAGLFTILNPSPLPPGGLDMASVSLLIANRLEAEALTGERDPAAAVNRLRAMGAGQVVITLGGEGAVLHDGRESFAIPAAKVDVVDTSGAGDCFAGTLAGLLHRGMPIVAAARLATLAAALSVGRAGTLSAFPTRVELSALASSPTLDIA
ncbi:ribokinase [Rhizobium sp. RU35A]|uniref:PfkB family carbohydrate kinase n=1 Tax=Rhizobium sp. RU35A TaxID=1907414 RepID=UPI00095656B6|nr:PfkB family carbohydrate kinase [Rhizobium sp. RU35A]SIQ60567.1 ribokinase [Rhizobium sp. RU35A]